MKSASAPDGVDGGSSAYAGAAIPLMTAALVSISRCFIAPAYPKSRPGRILHTALDKCSDSVNADVPFLPRAPRRPPSTATPALPAGAARPRHPATVRLGPPLPSRPLQ